MEKKGINLQAMKEEKMDSELLEQTESTEEENEVKELKYKRIDSVEGYITDETEIGYYKVIQTQEVIFNSMMGDYDEEGEYIIQKDILTALVKCHKHITRAYADTIYLQSYNTFGERGPIEFSLSFVAGKEGKQVAVLKILEPIDKINGYLINTHSFVVATYTDVNDENYMTKVKKVFHIFDSEEEGGKDDLEEVMAIFERLKLLALLKAELLRFLSPMEEKYFLARLEALKDVKFEAILQEFEALKNKAGMFLNEDSPFYFMYLNQVLDMALFNTKFKDPMLYAQAMEAIKVATQEYVKEFTAEYMKSLENVEKVTQNKDVQKIGASKSASKSDGKKANKSKPNKSSNFSSTYQDLPTYERSSPTPPSSPTPVTRESSSEQGIGWHGRNTSLDQGQERL